MKTPFLKYSVLTLLFLFFPFQPGHAQSMRFSASSLPIASGGYGHGASFGAFTRNGRPSLFVIAYGAPNNLYENIGASFRDIAAQAGVQFGTDHDRGMASADFDNDGDTDIYISAGYTGNVFWRNNGDDTYSDYTSESGTYLNGQGQGVAWGDFNNDGWLDLFVAQTDGGNRLYMNNGGGSFYENSGQFISQSGSIQPVAFDVDGNGYLDLLVTGRPGQSNLLYLNGGGASFSEQGNQWSIGYASADCQGAGVGDYDRDGDLDVFICDFGGHNLLFRNMGGRFDEVGAAAGIRSGGTRNRGALFGDFNDDGWPDIYVTRSGANQLFQNNGNGAFTEVAAAAGATGGSDGYSPSMADYDNDGDLDIFFTNTGQQSILLENLGTSNNRIELRLRGTESNANGVGAILTGWWDGRPQAQAIIAGQGYVGTGSDLTAHFGLGSSSFLDSLVVKWPSGVQDKYYHLAANQKLSLFEGNAPSDRTAPRISEVAADNVTMTGVTINWKTNENADSQVEYGLTTSYGNFSSRDGNLVTAHVMTLSNLTANTTYHYRVRSQDAAGNLAISGDFIFTTVRDTQAPALTNIIANNLAMTSAQIVWNSDEPADSQVEYGLTSSYGSLSPLNGNLVTAHVMTLSNLPANTTYHYRVRSRDAAGNLAISGDFTFTTARDTQAPAISNITTTAITAVSAQVKWNTDESSDARVEYGPDSTTFANSVLDTSFATTHTVNLVNLKARTTYYFRIIARDRAGNSRTGTKQSFTTLPTTAVEAKLNARPTTLALRHYPNPFHDFARFEIDLPSSGVISLKIYDLQGREVVTLAEGRRNAGQHLFNWPAQAGANRLTASGVYFAVLRYQNELKFSAMEMTPGLVRKQQLFYVK